MRGKVWRAKDIKDILLRQEKPLAPTPAQVENKISSFML